MVVFLCTFMADTKITPSHHFAAPLKAKTFQVNICRKENFLCFSEHAFFFVQLIHIKKMIHHLLQYFTRAKLWGIRILTKDNFKNNLINKTFQARGRRYFWPQVSQSLTPPLKQSVRLVFQCSITSSLISDTTGARYKSAYFLTFLYTDNGRIRRMAGSFWGETRPP